MQLSITVFSTPGLCIMTCNNNLFAPLAGKEPDDHADHTSTDCSHEDVMITASNCVPSRSQLLAWPIMRRIVLAPHLASTRPLHLGLEFQFSVSISGTLIASGILIPRQISGILVEIVFENSNVGNSSNQNSDLQNLEFLYFIHVGTKYISFCMYTKVNNRKHLPYLFPPK